MAPLRSDEFFGTYHGHLPEHLHTLIQGLGVSRPKLWLAGDSSLDNKFWLHGPKQPACNGYESVLSPSKCPQDIAYNLNVLLSSENSPFVAVNCAIEESTLAQRSSDLLPQDKIIRQYIRPEDVLVVSVGGNDIALSPSLKTIWNMLLMTKCNSMASLEAGTGWGMKHFVRLFRDRVDEYIQKLVGDVQPRLVLLCMIYFPDEKCTGSWADRTLALLGYNSNPRVLQQAIRGVFQHGTCASNTKNAVPVALYSVMDGSDSSLYQDRVEPSEAGGMAIAELLYSVLSSS